MTHRQFPTCSDRTGIALKSCSNDPLVSDNGHVRYLATFVSVCMPRKPKVKPGWTIENRTSYCILYGWTQTAENRTSYCIFYGWPQTAATGWHQVWLAVAATSRGVAATTVCRWRCKCHVCDDKMQACRCKRQICRATALLFSTQTKWDSKTEELSGSKTEELSATKLKNFQATKLKNFQQQN